MNGRYLFSSFFSLLQIWPRFSKKFVRFSDVDDIEKVAGKQWTRLTDDQGCVGEK